jgi:hypothetical protein
MGRQHGQIPIELVALDVHIHSLAKQGAADIPERRASDNGI